MAEFQAVIEALNDLGERVDDLKDEVKLEREKREQALRMERSNRLRGALATVVAFAMLAGLIYRNESQRNEQRFESRCNIRSGFVGIANAAQASPALVLAAIRDYDAAQGTGACGGIAVCSDGSYSEAAGKQGACSGHGGVERILVPR